jgi:1,2-diacylglycerol 3-alpha-glucosyltransferase
MRITHLCLANFYIEGMEYQENVLPRKHKELGYKVNIITSQYTFNSKGKEEERNVGKYLNSDNIPVTILPYSRGKYAKPYRIYDGLLEELLLVEPDIVFCHGPQFFSINELVKYKKKKPSLKIFVDHHSDYINTPIDSFKRKILHQYIWGHCARKIEKYAEIIWGVTPLRVRFLQDVYKIKPCFRQKKMEANHRVL